LTEGLSWGKLGIARSPSFPRPRPENAAPLSSGVLRFWVSCSPEWLTTRPDSDQSRATSQHERSEDSGREHREMWREHLPAARYKDAAPAGEGFCTPRAPRRIFEQGKLPADSGCESCYAARTVQAGTPMTIKEMGPAVSPRQAFSFLQSGISMVSYQSLLTATRRASPTRATSD